MDENVRNLENTILVTLPAGIVLDEAELRLRVEQLMSVFPVSDEERDHLLRRLHARLAIRMDNGVALVAPDHKPWLLARKPSIDPFLLGQILQAPLLARMARGCHNGRRPCYRRTA